MSATVPPGPEPGGVRQVGRAFLAGMVTLVVICLIVADEEKTFEWLLARALGLSLAWSGYEGFLWARRRNWWNEFFTAGIAGEAVVVLIHRTFLGYLPVLWPVLWISGPALTLAYAGGIRELTKGYRWPEQKAMAVSIGGGLVLHYVIVAGLVDAVFVMLTGKYP